MKDEESQQQDPTPAPNNINGNSNGNSSSNNGVTGNGKGRYKVWAIAGIIMLAVWSMLTGSVSLKSWSALNPLSDHIDSPTTDDLDILELEEREKLVRQLWNVYTHSTNIRLPKFWLEAFKAAYEDLINEVSSVRDGAVSEIAKLSVKSINLESSADQGETESPHDRSKSNYRVG